LKRTSRTIPTSSTPDTPGSESHLTATRAILLPGGSDHKLRMLLYNLFTLGNRMEEVRRYLGACISISEPQFSLLMAVFELQGTAGVSVGKIAEYLHVAGTFVTAESSKLAQKGYLEKRTGPRDRCISLLRVLPAGLRAIESLLPELQQVNDTFFELESTKGFEALCRSAERMVDGSRKVLELIRQNVVRTIGA
jgi:DNA-binding MarR family transcriptional regulator